MFSKRKLIIIGLVLVTLLSGCKKDISCDNEEVIIDEKISIFAVGDNLLHMPVVNSGKKSFKGEYFCFLKKSF